VTSSWFLIPQLFFVFSDVLLLNDLGARFIHVSKHVTHLHIIINSIYIQ